MSDLCADRQEIESYIQQANGELTRAVAALERLETAVEQLIRCEDFQGTLASQVKAYYESFHLTMIRGLKDAAEQLKSDQTKALEDFKRVIDSSEKAYVSGNQLSGLKRRLQKRKEEVDGIQREICQYVKEIASLGHFSIPDKKGLDWEYEKLVGSTNSWGTDRDLIGNLKKDLEQYDKERKTKIRNGKFAQQCDQLEKKIKENQAEREEIRQGIPPKPQAAPPPSSPSGVPKGEKVKKEYTWEEIKQLKVPEDVDEEHPSNHDNIFTWIGNALVVLIENNPLSVIARGGEAGLEFVKSWYHQSQKVAEIPLWSNGLMGEGIKKGFLGQEVNSIDGYLGAFAKGVVVDGIGKTAEGILKFLGHPTEGGEMVLETVKDPMKTMENTVQGLNEYIDKKIINGTPGERSAAAGLITFEAICLATGVKGAKKGKGLKRKKGKVSKVKKGVKELEGGNGSVQHAIGNANQAQSVLDGINPKYFNPESRFGGGFYVGVDSDTIVAELAEHGNTAKYAISYDMNLNGSKVLDLTNPQVASKWGYVQNLTSTKACQNIGTLAREQGYSVIKFQSYRGDGINYVIYNDFNNILSPRIVTPVE